jgi:hypothetical protein
MAGAFLGASSSEMSVSLAANLAMSSARESELSAKPSDSIIKIKLET